MLTLLNALSAPNTNTPDTGTYADGAIDMPLAELTKRRQELRRAAYARDYGLDRKVQTGAIGYC